MNFFITAARSCSLPGVVGGALGGLRTLMTRPQLPHALSSRPSPLLMGGVQVMEASPALLTVVPNSIIGGVFGRTKCRNYFPRPSEKKRIERHGWEKRMSTLRGRRIIMRRLLKGRHVLTH
ncbi:hypothetical protein Pmani_009107 [Petrolisthes manimaculis]|uniref:Large ribosomal subunit protein bL34m n=1 Tax=Petrolisthes manimaculis TaxID=1843537 RepID=A0AAE1UD86_9EUCA|nr:hypothetical protein Pmani_009107 [Petrolisthes manimaculis]